MATANRFCRTLCPLAKHKKRCHGGAMRSYCGPARAFVHPLSRCCGAVPSPPLPTPPPAGRSPAAPRRSSRPQPPALPPAACLRSSPAAAPWPPHTPARPPQPPPSPSAACCAPAAPRWAQGLPPAAAHCHCYPPPPCASAPPAPSAPGARTLPCSQPPRGHWIRIGAQGHVQAPADQRKRTRPRSPRTARSRSS